MKFELYLDPETGLYYYGARYYDPVLSTFISPDPLALKYLSSSPYNYAFLNPLIITDPDGREGIVVVGQPGTHGNDRHFLETGFARAITLRDKYNKEGKGETVSMLVYRGSNKEHDFSDKTYNEFETKAARSGIKMTKVSSADEIVNYVSNKTGENNARSNDKISDFTYVGHATPGNLDVGYGGRTFFNLFKVSEELDVSDFDISAFGPNSSANLTGGCNTAVAPMFGRSVANKMADKVSGEVRGSLGPVYFKGGPMSEKALGIPVKPGVPITEMKRIKGRNSQ